jgi:hypothetical protein
MHEDAEYRRQVGVARRSIAELERQHVPSARSGLQSNPQPTRMRMHTTTAQGGASRPEPFSKRSSATASPLPSRVRPPSTPLGTSPARRESRRRCGSGSPATTKRILSYHSKWRYVREDAFETLVQSKVFDRLQARALAAWSTHVQRTAHDLAVWVADRLGRQYAAQQAAVLMAKLRHAAGVCRAQRRTCLIRAWLAWRADAAITRQLHTCRCMHAWSTAAKSKTRARTLTRRLAMRRTRITTLSILRCVHHVCVRQRRLRPLLVRRQRRRLFAHCHAWRHFAAMHRRARTLLDRRRVSILRAAVLQLRVALTWLRLLSRAHRLRQRRYRL